MAIEYAQHRFTVDEYHRIGDAGVFAPDAHIELVDGELVERLVSMNPPHASVVSDLYELLHRAVAGRARVRCQLPITLGTFSEPEPDFAIVRHPRSSYKTRHPYESDMFTLIEVADRSRDFDVRRKVRIYAEFGISETWVVDLADSCLRVFRDPSGRAYRDVSVGKAGDAVALLAFPETPILVADILE